MSDDAGIEPTTVVTLALTARRSNQLARSHPQRKTCSTFFKYFSNFSLQCENVLYFGKVEQYSEAVFPPKSVPILKETSTL